MNDLETITKFFNPQRLTLARERRGLTKAALSRKIGVTPSAMSQFENGSISPNSSTLAKIALALGFPPAYFARPGGKSISLAKCHFRSLRSATQRERRQVVSIVPDFLDLIQVIEQRIDGLPSISVPDLSDQLESDEDVEDIAMLMRREFGLGSGPIDNVVRLLEWRMGVHVLPLVEDSERVDAFSFWLDGRPFIFLSFDKDSSSRLRFSASHELAHLLMHRETDLEPGDKELEAQANRFASAFLLPAESFGAECPDRLDWHKLLELKVRWKVSVAAIVRRAFDLKIFSESQYRRAMIQITQMGWRKNEPHEPVQERLTLLTRAIPLLKESYEPEGWPAELELSFQTLRKVLEAMSEEKPRLVAP